VSPDNSPLVSTLRSGPGGSARRPLVLVLVTMLLTSLSLVLAPPATPAPQRATAAKPATPAKKKASPVKKKAAPAKAFPYDGADISWPQCPVDKTRGMPSSARKFVVFGLTGGVGFKPNTCLAEQVAWAKKRHKYLAAYSFTGAPTVNQLKKYGRSGPYHGKTERDRFRNTGYAAARKSITDMRAAGLKVPFVWVDIERSWKQPWKKSRWKNTAYVQGQLRAYTHAGMRVGLYVQAGTYDGILDKDFKLPEWRAVGERTRAKALRQCSERSVQGGRIVLSQWWTQVKDYDVICPKQRTWKKLKIYFSAKS
jgi:hypothetical protein